MNLVTPDLAEPVGLTRKRTFPQCLADGVSQPPWSGRATILAVLVTLATFIASPWISELVERVWPGLVRYFDSSWPSLLSAIPMLACLIYLSERSGTTFGKLFGFRGGRVHRIILSGFLLFFLESLVSGAVVAVFKLLGLKGNTHIKEEAAEIASSFFTLTDATVWAPVVEEICFRGLFYIALRTRFRVGTSIFITAAGFALAHAPGGARAIIGIFCAALLSSFWYERTRCLWPNIISHMLTNLVTTLLWAYG